MKLGRLAVPALLVLAAMTWQNPAPPAAAPAQAHAGIQWGPAPPFFPQGARFAVLQGNPGGAGVYTVRLSMPNGYTIKPHWHPTDEHITVIMGTFKVGMGDSVETGHMQALGAGDFITAPARAHHYAVAQGQTVVQVHGMGPFAITYVRAADDPRTPTASR